MATGSPTGPICGSNVFTILPVRRSVSCAWRTSESPRRVTEPDTRQAGVRRGGESAPTAARVLRWCRVEP